MSRNGPLRLDDSTRRPLHRVVGAQPQLRAGRGDVGGLAPLGQLELDLAVRPDREPGRSASSPTSETATVCSANATEIGLAGKGTLQARGRQPSERREPQIPRRLRFEGPSSRSSSRPPRPGVSTVDRCLCGADRGTGVAGSPASSSPGSAMRVFSSRMSVEVGSIRGAEVEDMTGRLLSVWCDHSVLTSARRNTRATACAFSLKAASPLTWPFVRKHVPTPVDVLVDRPCEPLGRSTGRPGRACGATRSRPEESVRARWSDLAPSPRSLSAENAPQVTSGAGRPTGTRP